MPPFRLYLISDEQRYPGVLQRTLEHLQGAQPFGLQIREKSLAPQALVSFWKNLSTPPTTIYSYFNDRADLALSCGLHGVHLREESCDLKLLHPVFKDQLSLGVSTHSLEGVLRAQQNGAHFVTLGPIFETPSKAGYGTPLGLESLRQATQQATVPIFALGGVTLDKVEACVDAGAYGVSAISAIWGTAHPEETIIEFQKTLMRARLRWSQPQTSPQTVTAITDVYYMQQAIALGKQAQGQTGNNPYVGCVIVKEGQVIGQGKTQPPGQPHAEASAILNAVAQGYAVAGATVYTTVEPCSFHGRTPSCALALIEQKVARVVLGIRDPHPRVNGQGMQMLQTAGIEVLENICAEEIRAYLRDWLALQTS